MFLNNFDDNVSLFVLTFNQGILKPFRGGYAKLSKQYDADSGFGIFAGLNEGPEVDKSSRKGVIAFKG